MSLSTADFETLPDDEFKKVLAALNKVVARQAKGAEVSASPATDPRLDGLAPPQAALRV